MIALSLPYPPSANHLWTNAGKKQMLLNRLGVGLNVTAEWALDLIVELRAA